MDVSHFDRCNVCGAEVGAGQAHKRTCGLESETPPGGLGAESPKRALLWESNTYGRSYARNGAGGLYLWIERRTDGKYDWGAALDITPGSDMLVSGVAADYMSARKECAEQALEALLFEISQINGEGAS